MTQRPERTSYDEVPYPGFAYVQSHPDHLAAIATLLGIPAIPVTSCRVLELGCADGGNLIPMAAAYPEARFVGIDLSSVQIELGHELIEQLGLTNIRLVQANILDIDPEFGLFDYILAHGIYSWVPAHVRDALLQICNRNLSPHGIAYISYNAYPGWHIFEPIRALLRYSTTHVSDPIERLARARELLELLTVERSADDIIGAVVPLSATMLKDRLDTLRPGSDVPILLHDIMEEHNQPVYFHEFATHAAQYGLQYVAEASFSMVLPRGLPDRITDYIRKMAANGIDIEQYMDLFRGRMFRQTLLCHANVPIERMLRPANLMGMAISSRAVLEGSELDLQPGVVARYHSSDSAILSIDTPVSKAALVVLLDAWPQALPFDTLLDRAITQVSEAGVTLASRDVMASQLAADLLTAFCYSDQLANFYTSPPAVATKISERPIAWPLARVQAHIAGSSLTTLYHENAEPDPMARELIKLLDGTHDQAMLVQAVEQLIAAGVVPADDDAVPLEATIGRSLRWALWIGLLIA